MARNDDVLSGKCAVDQIVKVTLGAGDTVLYMAPILATG